MEIAGTLHPESSSQVPLPQNGKTLKTGIHGEDGWSTVQRSKELMHILGRSEVTDQLAMADHV